MKNQFKLLREVPWRALVILDACRVDYFLEVCDGSAETVQSAGVCTKSWMRAVIGAGVLNGPLTYFNANPVVTRELNYLGGPERRGIELVDVWRDGWDRHTELKIPTVHPREVIYRAGEHVRGAGLPERMVLHFIQPHSPYIGATPLALTRWGRGEDGLNKAAHRLGRPEKAVGKGETSWELVRRAYRDNLKLAWEHAKSLVEWLEGPVVFTSDHGEVLGEHDGKFGHECHWVRFRELYEVPWLEVS